MNICIITGSVTRSAGGLFFSVRALTQHSMRHKDLNFEVWSIRENENITDVDQWSPIIPRVFRKSFSGKFGFSIDMIRAFLASDFDLIHIHGLWGMPSLIAHLALIKNIPVVVSPRGMLDPWILGKRSLLKNLYAKFFEYPLLRKVSVIHALSQEENLAISFLNLGVPVVTIPNGVVMPLERVKFADRNPDFILSYIGRYDNKKGLLEFINSWASIDIKLREKWKIYFYGWGSESYKNLLIDRISKLGLSPSCIVNGPVYGRDKVNVLQKSFAFILPTKSEGLPMAVLEAWAYGVPVLTTKHANLQIGFLNRAAIDIGSEECFTKNISKFLNDAELIGPILSENGIELTRKYFSWPKIANDTVEIYRHLVS